MENRKIFQKDGKSKKLPKGWKIEKIFQKDGKYKIFHKDGKL